MSNNHLIMKLPAQAENLSVVRQAVGNLARLCGMSEGAIDDLRLVVTEACSNVVVHAYRNRPRGPLEVEASCLANEFDLVVRDQGTGFRAPAISSGGSLRLGMALISTLSSSLDVCERDGGGTEVSICLPLTAAG